MATTASFAGSTLSILDDGASDTVAVSRDGAGAILVNGGAVPITGGTPSVVNTSLVSILAGAGDDTVTVNETNGALPAANISGEAGNDTLTGGSAKDQIFGGLDNDTLLGKGGADTLFGGAGNDILTGGDGDDVARGEAGDDRFIWNPGDDSDVFEGGDGTDTVEVNAGLGAETFAISANGPRVRVERTNPAPFAIDLGATEQLVLNANAGADQVLIEDLTGTDLHLITVNLANTIGNGDGAADQVTINTGTGNDLVSLTTTASVAAMITVLVAEAADSIQVNGMAGSDTIVAGSFAHALNIDGGTESDTVSYAAAISGVTANIANAALNTGAATGHTYISIESIIGSAFQDLLTGNAGANTLDGGAGSDLLQGLGGDDFYVVDNAGDVIDEAAGAGFDTVMTSISLTLSAAADIEVLATTATSNAAINLTGNAVSQSIFGNRGANYLKGKGGDDTLSGGRGSDTLNGGRGDDSFVFNTRPKTINIDTIKSYVRADDTILLDHDIFGGITAMGKLAKSAFHASTSGKAHDLSDRILYETDTGRLYYDKDGTGSAHAVHFATLTGHPTIGAHEFVIV